MRIATWNCYRGKLAARAAVLDGWAPDVTVIQECARPDGEPDGSWVWCGTNPKHGTGAVAANGYRLEAVACDPAIEHSVFPARVTGPVSFNLLMIWSHAKPTYIASVQRGLDAYASFIGSAPTVVIGDFNATLGPGPLAKGHAALVARLGEEFGLVNAFDLPAAGTHASSPTLYFQWREDRPFQCDYCWVPAGWAGCVTEVRVGGFGEFSKSDHRPVMVSLDESRLPPVLPAIRRGRVPSGTRRGTQPTTRKPRS